MMKPILVISATLCVSSGCATALLEQRVITQFVDALEEENVPAIRRVASTEFQQKAMRSDNVVRDLEIVKLPKGDLEIVDVAEPSEDHRSVIVSDGSGDKYKFELIRDAEHQKWAVDDVIVRQRKKWNKTRLNVTWPASHVLDLVFSVREYLEVWSTSQRNQILSKSSPALAASLEVVPESWLPLITGGISDNYDSALARKPEAQLHDDSAVVRMPVRGGYLLVSAVRMDDQWLMDDIEIHSRSDSGHPGSVRRQADAVGSLSRFLTAFAAGDRQLLQDSSTPKFYNGTLQFADLNLVALPPADVAPDELSIRAFSGQVTIIVPTQRDFIRFDLVDPNQNEKQYVARLDSPRRFQVDDVILNDRTRRNERTLGSVFTAPARASLFVSALQARNIGMLKQLSTREFNQEVWERVSPELLHRLTLPAAQLGDITLDGSDVRGRRTELTFNTPSGGQVKFRMLEQIGRLVVDDIQFPNKDNQTLSLRIQTAVQIPVAEFTAAWRAADLAALKDSCSTAFDRLVLNHFTTFPQDILQLADRLDTALRSTRVTEGRATVHMGLASTDTAQVHLIQEHNRWVVDDVSIPEVSGQTIRIRTELRQEVAGNMLARSAEARHLRQAPRQNQPVPQREPARQSHPDGSVIQAGGISRHHTAVNSARFEVFGPNSSRLEAKLRNPMSFGADTKPKHQDQREIPRPPTGEVSHRKHVRPAENPFEDDEYIRFGPGALQAGTLGEISAESHRPLVEKAKASKTLNLAENPVSID